MTKKWLLLENIFISRLEWKNHTLFMPETAKKAYSLGPHKLIEGWSIFKIIRDGFS